MLLFSAPLHSLRKTKVFRRLLKSKLNRPKMYNLGFDHKVALRPLTHSSIRRSRRRKEPNIHKSIQSVVLLLDEKKDKRCFLDVGANVGIYSWGVHNLCPSRKIIACEPDPRNFQLLQMTLKHCNPNNITILPLALSNESRQASFLQDELTSATGTLEDGTKPWVELYLNGSAKKIVVGTTTIDKVTKESSVPSLIKIDVEGHELEVLDGAKDTLNQVTPSLIIESFPPKQKTVIKLLLSRGYEIIDADHSCHVNEFTQNLFAWHPSGLLTKEEVLNVSGKTNR